MSFILVKKREKFISTHFQSHISINTCFLFLFHKFSFLEKCRPSLFYTWNVDYDIHLVHKIYTIVYISWIKITLNIDTYFKIYTIGQIYNEKYKL